MLLFLHWTLGVCEPRLTQVVMNCADVVVQALGNEDLSRLRDRLAVRADSRVANARSKR